jgi:meiotically up-regulated gene 157 (Mug157) protein
MEAWYRWKRKKKDKPIFRETFKQSINNILHSYFEDNDANKAYEYYIDKIQNDSLLNKRYGHLI